MPDPSLSSCLVRAAILAGSCLVQFAYGQNDAAKDYPSKPVRFIVPGTPGGGPDTTARAIAQKLSEAWGRQVVVDNRSGASGVIGIDFVAKAVPDGYTICMISASNSVISAVNSGVPYDLTKDLAAISRVSSLFYVAYHRSSIPVRSLKELIAYSKAHPGKLNYGTPGAGSLQHLAVELFIHMTGAKLVHVPFRGGPAAIAAARAGEVQVGFATLFGLRPHVPSGRLRLLAITARERSPAVPELPTMAEAGVPGYEVDQWFGVITVSKVPAAIIKKLNAGISEALRTPYVVERLQVDGATPASSSPKEFDAQIKAEIAKWRKLVKDAGLVLH